MDMMLWGEMNTAVRSLGERCLNKRYFRWHGEDDYGLRGDVNKTNLITDIASKRETLLFISHFWHHTPFHAHLSLSPYLSIFHTTLIHPIQLSLLAHLRVDRYRVDKAMQASAGRRLGEARRLDYGKYKQELKGKVAIDILQKCADVATPGCLDSFHYKILD